MEQVHPAKYASSPRHSAVQLSHHSWASHTCQSLGRSTTSLQLFGQVETGGVHCDQGWEDQEGVSKQAQKVMSLPACSVDRLAFVKLALSSCHQERLSRRGRCGDFLLWMHYKRQTSRSVYSKAQGI